MKPERMLHATLLCRNEDRERIIKTLADLKMLHISDHQKEVVSTATIDIGAPLENAEEVSAALVIARNLLAKIPLHDTAPATDALHLSNRIARIRELGSAYSEHEEELEKLQARMQEIEMQRAILDQLPPDEPLAALKARSTCSLLLKAKREEIATPLLYCKENAESIFVTLRRSDAAQLDHLERIDLGPILYHNGTARSASAALSHEYRVLASQAQQRTAALANFAPHRPFLQHSEQILALELLKAQAPLRFGTTKHLTIIRGYIPTRRETELQAALDAAGITVIAELTKAHEAPTALNHPKAKGFESLIELYTLPKYNEIDPTNLMAFTFPLFFGFMLGDIGYGALALLTAWLLSRHVPKMKSIASILMVSAAATIVFGFIYGEFFGAESILGLVHLTPLLHRTQDIMLMFGIAIGIGALHLNLGLVLGMINEWENGALHAIVSKGSWMLLQVAAVLLAAAYGLLSFPVPVLAAWGVLLMAVAGIAYGERIKGLLELPMIFSNMLSYTRLVALGLASVYLAFVINQIAGDLFAKGGVWIALGAVILLVGHAINLMLGLLGPFLHSLRLHYVEFFTKFYEGGGTPYTPFGKMGETT